MILCVLFIPLFMEAQITDPGYYWTDLDGNTNFEPCEFPISENTGTSRTEAVQMPGWPKTGLESIKSKVAVGDIDPDYPGLEIVAVGTTNSLYVWHNDGTAVSGFPQIIGNYGILKAPVISDIDDDGNLEIIVGQNMVRVYNHDGTVYPGWPQSLDTTCWATPAVADVDNDGMLEICAVSNYSVYLWDKDGNDKPGWPKLNVAGRADYAAPIFADLDDDGDLEILHAYYDQWPVPSDNYIGIYHHDGTNYGNWPQMYLGAHTFLTPVVGDIDNDGDLEIIGGRGNGFDFMAKHHTGETVDGWPVQVTAILECSSIVFDLDNDGYREVVFGENWPGANGFLYAFNGDGSTVEDWPTSISGPTMVNSPSVGDVDGDGDIEIALIVSGGTVNLWTLEDVPYKKYLTEWATYFHDNWNTGWYHPIAPQNLTYESSGNSVTLDWNENTEPDLTGYNVYRSNTTGGPYTKLNSTLITETSYNYISDPEDNFYCVTAEIKAGSESRLSTEIFGQTSVGDELIEPIISLSNYPNPFNSTTTISFQFSNEQNQQNEQTKLEIFNLKGQRIRQYSILNNQSTIVWDGRDENGNAASSGIYFYKVKTGRYTSTKKMILMK